MTSWTVVCWAPLSIGFSRQEYWSALPFPSPGHLPDPGIEAGFPALQADSLPSEPLGKPENRENGGKSTHLTGYYGDSMTGQMQNIPPAT